MGILAQRVYGYKPVPSGSSISEEIATDRKNALSLAKALYTAIGIPMAMCCFIYLFLYKTYPRDRERAKMEARIESEMQQIMADNISGDEDYSQVRILESEDSSVKDRSVIEMDYEVDFLDQDDDDNDEDKILLRRELTLSYMAE